MEFKLGGLADFSKTTKFNSANRSMFVMKQLLVLSFHQIKIRELANRQIRMPSNLPAIINN